MDIKTTTDRDFLTHAEEAVGSLKITAIKNGQNQEMISMVIGFLGLDGVSKAVQSVAEANKEVERQADLALSAIRERIRELS